MKDNISFTDTNGCEVIVARIHLVSIETVMSMADTIMNYVVRTTVRKYSVDRHQYEKLKGK